MIFHPLGHGRMFRPLGYSGTICCLGCLIRAILGYHGHSSHSRRLAPLPSWPQQDPLQSPWFYQSRGPAVTEYLLRTGAPLAPLARDMPLDLDLDLNLLPWVPVTAGGSAMSHHHRWMRRSCQETDGNVQQTSPSLSPPFAPLVPLTRLGTCVAVGEFFCTGQ